MDATGGRFRLLPRTDHAGTPVYTLVRLDPAGADGSDGAAPTGATADDPPEELYDPVRVAAEGYEGDLADAVAALEAGAVVSADLSWHDSVARFESVTEERPDRLYVYDGVEPLFEAARDAWEAARTAGEPMTSLVTRDTAGDPNGACYLFADGGAADRLAEFETGVRPVEPLVERVNDERGTEPRDLFLLRPAGLDVVAVYVVFEQDGTLSRTLRATYGDGSAEGLALGDVPLDGSVTGGGLDDDHGFDDGPL